MPSSKRCVCLLLLSLNCVSRSRQMAAIICEALKLLQFNLKNKQAIEIDNNNRTIFILLPFELSSVYSWSRSPFLALFQQSMYTIIRLRCDHFSVMFVFLRWSDHHLLGLFNWGWRYWKGRCDGRTMTRRRKAGNEREIIRERYYYIIIMMSICVVYLVSRIIIR